MPARTIMGYRGFRRVTNWGFASARGTPRELPRALAWNVARYGTSRDVELEPGQTPNNVAWLACLCMETHIDDIFPKPPFPLCLSVLGERRAREPPRDFALGDRCARGPPR